MGIIRVGEVVIFRIEGLVGGSEGDVSLNWGGNQIKCGVDTS